MDNPDQVLLNLLQSNWVLTDVGLKKADIRFTQIGWRSGDANVSEALKGLYGINNIWVERSGLRRLDEIENFFLYQAIVRVVYWCKTKSAVDVQADKANHWKMIEHVKKLVQTEAYWSADWKKAQIGGTNAQNVEPPIPPYLLKQ